MNTTDQAITQVLPSATVMAQAIEICYGAGTLGRFTRSWPFNNHAPTRIAIASQRG